MKHFIWSNYIAQYAAASVTREITELNVEYKSTIQQCDERISISSMT